MSKLKFLLTIFVVFFCLKSAEASSAKTDFIYIYASDWERANLKYTLFKISENQFKEMRKTTGMRTAGFQIGLNINNIVEKIQTGILQEFRDEYDGFLTGLQKRLPKNYLEIRNRAEENFVHNAWQDLKPNILNPLRVFVWIALGGAVFIVGEILARTSFGGLKVTRNVIRFTKITSEFAGVVLLIVGMIQASQISATTRIKAKEFLYERTRDFYASELPRMYRDALN